MADDASKTEQQKTAVDEPIEAQEEDNNQPADLIGGAKDEAFDGNDNFMGLITLQAELSKAREELATAQEEVLRMHADTQNVKRRTQQDVEKAHKFALEKFSESLLPVVDSLERGLESTEEIHGSMKEGMELTLKLFLDTLKKFNVEQVNPMGVSFDPQLHQAISQIDSADQEPGSVLSVVQKGYTLNGRLIRPAMVVVAKA